MRIFLSAVSGRFKVFRDALASDLRAIGCEVRVQEDFQQGPRTLIERLEEYVAQCDRVIALVGDAYGTEAAGGPMLTLDQPRSYTQWEYWFAAGERLQGPKAQPKELYVYFASELFLREHPARQDTIAQQRQQSFVQRIKDSGKHWGKFDAVDQLCRLVLRDAFQLSERPALTEEIALASIATVREALTAGIASNVDEVTRDAIRRHSPRTLEEYRVGRWAEWSQPRYALDKRFTQLTVLVDHGPDAQGTRWQAQPRSFQDLREVLAEVSEPAVVVLGPPGCGKSTLLRRLELDFAVDALCGSADAAPLSVFLPLNRYRPSRPGDLLPMPHEWIAREWTHRFPDMPAFAKLLRSGRLVLLLDAVNEMPHAGQEDYREHVALWRDFLADLAHSAPGTHVLFSCRSLDYSASLSTPDLPVPHVRIEQLADAQVEEFLALYLVFRLCLELISILRRLAKLRSYAPWMVYRTMICDCPTSFFKGLDRLPSGAFLAT